MDYHFINKGEWDKQRKALLSIEDKCFKRKDRTHICIFKEFINDIEPFTLIVRDGCTPIGYFMCAPLEDSGDDLKRWDKQFGKHNTLYVFSIGVIPEYRHAGIGYEMMKKLIHKAYQQYDRITLHTCSPGFYSMCIKYGFRDIRTGVLDNHKMVYMGKWLKCNQ